MTDTAHPEDLRLSEFRPRSELVVDAHPVERARFPAIDAHNHLGYCRTPDDVARAVAEMDAAGVKAMIDLDGNVFRPLADELRLVRDAHPGRFCVLTALPWQDEMAEGGDFGARLAARLRQAVREGARGLKIFKELGLRHRDAAGRTIMPHDERLAAVFAACGDLGVPCLYHVADPRAFFRPLDRFNERYEELLAHPDWHFYGGDFPTYEALMESQERLLEAHPGTTFQSAHVASASEDLGYVRRLLERYPNLHVDISARLAELGRQPYTARRLFLDFPDRILYATDLTPRADVQRTYMRLLETRDEHFPYYPGDEQGQGRWRIYGLGLPDEVLRKVYSENAERLYGPMG